MPAEVFDAWFAPLIKSDVWPFLSEFAFAVKNDRSAPKLLGA
jgi:hypothetical protein